jgi:hypothetical protein
MVRKYAIYFLARSWGRFLWFTQLQHNNKGASAQLLVFSF